MTRKSLCWFAGSCALFNLVACYPATELARPRLVPAGHLQVAVATTLQSKPPWRSHPDGPYLGPQIGARVGLADRVELNGRLSVASIEGGARIGLLQSEHPNEVDLSLGVAVTSGLDQDGLTDESPTPSSTGQYIGVRVPLMLGYRGQERLHPWLATTLHAGSVTHNDDGSQRKQDYAAVSAALGIDIELSEWITMQPQVAYLRPFLDNDLVGDARLTAGDRRWAASLGFFFGRPHRSD